MDRLKNFEIRNGIYFPQKNFAEMPSRYQQQWDKEAADDHVRSAIARSSEGREDFATITAKVSKVWQNFPLNRHYNTVLDVGCGYGRIPLYLANERGLTCNRFYGVDISERMLQHLLRYKIRFNLLAAAKFYPICTSTDILPLADASIDLVISSAVFLHMGKNYVRRTLTEIARILKPDGAFIFDASFPNTRNVASFPARLLALRGRRHHNPNYMKYYSHREIKRFLRISKLSEKIPQPTIEVSDYALLPKDIRGIPIPYAREINQKIVSPPKWTQNFLAVTYTVHGGIILGHPG